MNLNSLGRGQYARVVKVKAEGSVKRRLNELGVIPDTLVYFIRKSPLGDPVAFYVRGSTVAIRKTDLNNIIIDDIKEC